MTIIFASLGEIFVRMIKVRFSSGLEAKRGSFIEDQMSYYCLSKLCTDLEIYTENFFLFCVQI